MNKTGKSVLMVILDGFGKNPIEKGNPVPTVSMTSLDMFISKYPYAVVEASGNAVGLPWGEVGNSEVGHINLGLGQVIYQNLPRITLSIDDETFFSNQVLLEAVGIARKNKSKIHLIGLMSNGGVHSHIDHLKGLIRFMKMQNFKDVFVHGILDGRDTSAQEASVFIKEINQTFKKYGRGKLASLIGRYYAMDRNNNWDRTKKAYDLWVNAEGEKDKDSLSAIKRGYQQKNDDETMEAICLTDWKGKPLTKIKDKDVVICFNFRPDRSRQLSKALVAESFNEFERNPAVDIHFVSMMQYDAAVPTPLVFKPHEVKNPIGKVISLAGLKQLRIAETEKYAHVTYFFNGGNETPYKNEDHILVPSPDVSSYDQQPSMSSLQVTEKLLNAISQKKYDFMLVNYANPDMIGHTGNFKAVQETLQVMDEHLKKLYDLHVMEQGGVMLIVADHGNCEVMKDPFSGKINKQHTTNPVSFFLIEKGREINKSPNHIRTQKMDMTSIGILADIGPTVLALLGVDKTSEMTGINLLNDCQ